MAVVVCVWGRRGAGQGPRIFCCWDGASKTICWAHYGHRVLGFRGQLSGSSACCSPGMFVPCVHMHADAVTPIKTEIHRERPSLSVQRGTVATTTGEIFCDIQTCTPMTNQIRHPKYHDAVAQRMYTCSSGKYHTHINRLNGAQALGLCGEGCEICTIESYISSASHVQF